VCMNTIGRVGYRRARRTVQRNRSAVATPRMSIANEDRHPDEIDPNSPKFALPVQ